MKRQTKRNIGLLLLGSTIAVAGTALYLYFDENARETVEGMVNREKAKLYVRYHLKGNDSLINAVDKLSDSEVNTLVKLAESADDMKDNVEDKVTDLLKGARKVTDAVAERVHF